LIGRREEGGRRKERGRRGGKEVCAGFLQLPRNEEGQKERREREEKTDRGHVDPR
jgi:hypothetical protein